MRLVTAQAVLKDHEWGVGFMALQAAFNPLMFLGMAECAVFQRVLAGKFFEFLTFFRMAGLAGLIYPVFIGNGYV